MRPEQSFPPIETQGEAVPDTAPVEATEIDSAAVTQDTLGMYLNEISKHELLDREEVSELSKTIEAGLLAERVRHLQTDPEEAMAFLQQERQNSVYAPVNKALSEEELAHLHFLANEKYTSDEDKQLLDELTQEGKAAYQKMIESNLRLVVRFAKGYQRQGVELQDLIQEGNLGLAHAVKAFDYQKGFTFSTYAPWWIRLHAQRHISKQGGAFALPKTVAEQVHKSNRLRMEFSEQFGREPSDEEMAGQMGMKLAKYKELAGIDRHAASLDLELGADGESTLGNLQASDADTEGDVERKSMLWDVEHAMFETLTSSEAELLRLHYGFNGEPLSYKQMEKTLKIPAETIRKAVKLAEDKFRNSSHAEVLKTHL